MYPNYRAAQEQLSGSQKQQLCAWGTVFALEPLYASSGINNLLLTGEERMACVADFDLDHRHCSASLKSIAANTANFALNVLRVDFGLHDALQMRSNNNSRSIRS